MRPTNVASPTSLAFATLADRREMDLIGSDSDTSAAAHVLLRLFARALPSNLCAERSRRRAMKFLARAADAALMVSEVPGTCEATYIHPGRRCCRDLHSYLPSLYLVVAFHPCLHLRTWACNWCSFSPLHSHFFSSLAQPAHDLLSTGPGHCAAVQSAVQAHDVC